MGAIFKTRLALGIIVLVALIIALLVAPTLFRGPQETATTPITTPGTTTPTEAPPTETPRGTVPTTPPQVSPVTLRVITRHPGEIQVATKEAFLRSEIARMYNIVNIEFYSLDPVVWVSAITRRGDFDVAWGGGPTLFDTLYLNRLLAPLEGRLVGEAIAQIPDTLAGTSMKRVGPDGKVYWVAASVASFGFTVNYDVIRKFNLPVPSKWSDLASPELGRPLVREVRPMVSIADPTRSTSHTRMYEIILQAYGWELGWVNLTLMAANSLIEGGSTEARDNVNEGRVAVAITIDFFGYTVMKANPATEYIIPEGETIVNGDPIALLATSKNVEAAKAFIAWVLTDGQKIWFREDINRLPANPKSFETPEGAQRKDLKAVFDKLATIKGINFDDDRALKIEKAMQAYFKATLVDLDSLLKEVWRKLLELYFAGKISEAQFREYCRRLGEPLTYVDPVARKIVKFTEDDAMRVVDAVSKDVRLEDSYVRAWRTAAEDRYRSLLEELRRLG
ncbi:MAG: ABC transporter substrate-binding protein [Thermoprotei archaeon]|nr:ABC transporter substrate-binding protein [Thermoprotei archaeon]